MSRVSDSNRWSRKSRSGIFRNTSQCGVLVIGRVCPATGRHMERQTPFPFQSGYRIEFREIINPRQAGQFHELQRRVFETSSRLPQMHSLGNYCDSRRHCLFDRSNKVVMQSWSRRSQWGKGHNTRHRFGLYSFSTRCRHEERFPHGFGRSRVKPIDYTRNPTLD